MSDVLDVWLNGLRVAFLTSDGPGGGASLTYTAESIERWGTGFPLLSVRLPVSEDMYPATKTRTFIDGLLPEDHVRALLANRARVATGDTFGLLRAYGLDCAGAVQVLEPGTSATKGGEVRWLTDIELADAVTDLPSAPLGISVDPGVRSSLGGLQGKMVVVIEGDRLGLPLNGQPSTHILKPARLTEKGEERWPGIAQLETFGLRLIQSANKAGLSVMAPDSRVIDISGRQAILVKRFDRVVDAAGLTRRIHQEDFAQALGIKEKYQRDPLSPPRLIDIAKLLANQATTPAQSLIELLEMVTINAVLGNCDMHARNLALLHTNGRIGLTPAYDVVPTAVWPDHERELALRIGGEPFLDDLRGDNLLEEALSWGMRRPVAKRIIKRTLDALTQSLPIVRQAAIDESWDHPTLGDAVTGALARIALLRLP